MDGSGNRGLSADKLLLKEGLILSYMESVAGELDLRSPLWAVRHGVVDPAEDPAAGNP